MSAAKNYDAIFNTRKKIFLQCLHATGSYNTSNTNYLPAEKTDKTSERK